MSDPQPLTDAIERLEKWKFGHKSRTVTIEIDCGYGAHCWNLLLCGHGKVSEFAEVELLRENDDSDWPGLAKTIHAALNRAEELGL